MTPSRVARKTGKHWIGVIVSGVMFLCGVAFFVVLFDVFVQAPAMIMAVSALNIFLLLVFVNLLDVARGFELERTHDSWRIVYYRHLARREVGGLLEDIRWIDRIVSADGGAGTFRIVTRESMFQTRIFPEEWTETGALRKLLVGEFYNADDTIPDTTNAPTWRLRHWGLAVEDARFATTAKGFSYVVVDSSGRTVIVQVDKPYASREQVIEYMLEDYLGRSTKVMKAFREWRRRSGVVPIS